MKRVNYKRVLLVVGCFSCLVVSTIFLVSQLFSNDTDQEDIEEDIVEVEEDNTVSFLAVGDNIGHDRVNAYGDINEGEYGDGSYSFLPSYSNVASYIEEADLSFVNQETIIGGDDIGIYGYPAFNTPEQMAQDLVSLGFDIINGASNHTCDMGLAAINFTCELWRQFEEVIYVGVYDSQEDADTIKTIERNGITFSVLSYTYGTNGYTIPNDYNVYLFDEDKITADVAKAKEVSDVVIVSCHWGTESVYDITDTQEQYAQLLADLEVDLVLGHHAHIIQSVEWVEGVNGNETLVAYGLGNFLSTMETLDTQLEGMLSLDFVKTDDDVVIENVEWISLVNHFEDGFETAAPTVYLLSEYSEELRQEHYVLSDYPDALEYFEEKTAEIMSNISIRE